MRRLRPLVVVVGLCVFGGLGTMAVGAALGMHAADLATLAAYLLPALALTVLAIVLANRLLANVSLRQRFVVIAVAGTVVTLGNLFALTRAMAVAYALLSTPRNRPTKESGPAAARFGTMLKA